MSIELRFNYLQNIRFGTFFCRPRANNASLHTLLINMHRYDEKNGLLRCRLRIRSARRLSFLIMRFVFFAWCL